MLFRSFTVGLARDEARNGVRVLGVSPSPVETTRFQNLLLKHAEDQGIDVGEARRRVLSEIPMGRAATPQEIADVIVFLVSDRAAFMTGTIVAIDGGASCTA